jgi:hypothetical protein
MNGAYTATVRQLLDIAPVVFESSHFAIKGGTALNLFLHDLPRLSVDIDVVFTDHTLDRAVALPFHQGRRPDWFSEMQLPFPPWRHQELPFQRLSSGSHDSILLLIGLGPVGWPFDKTPATSPLASPRQLPIYSNLPSQ